LSQPSCTDRKRRGVRRLSRRQVIELGLYRKFGVEHAGALVRCARATISGMGGDRSAAQDDIDEGARARISAPSAWATQPPRR